MGQFHHAELQQEEPPLKKIRLDVSVPHGFEFLSPEQQEYLSRLAADFVQQQMVAAVGGAAPTETVEPAVTSMLVTHSATTAGGACADGHAPVEHPVAPTACIWSDAVPVHIRSDLGVWCQPGKFGVAQIVDSVIGDEYDAMRTWAMPVIATTPMDIGTYRKRSIHGASLGRVLPSFYSTNGTEAATTGDVYLDINHDIQGLAARTNALIPTYAYADNLLSANEGGPVSIRAIEFCQTNSPALECKESRLVVPNTRLHYTFVRVAWDLIFVVPVLLSLDRAGNVEVLVDKSMRRLGGLSNVVFSDNADDTGAVGIFASVFKRMNSDGARPPSGLVFRHTTQNSTPALVGSRASAVINQYFGANFEPTVQDGGDGKFGQWLWAHCDGLTGKSTKGATMAPIPFAVFLAHYILFELSHKKTSSDKDATVVSPLFGEAAAKAWAAQNMSYDTEARVLGEDYESVVHSKATILACATVIVDAIKDASANWAFSRSDVSTELAIQNSRRVLPQLLFEAAEQTCEQQQFEVHTHAEHAVVQQQAVDEPRTPPPSAQVQFDATFTFTPNPEAYVAQMRQQQQQFLSPPGEGVHAFFAADMPFPAFPPLHNLS